MEYRPFWSNILKGGGADDGEADEEDVSLKRRTKLVWGRCQWEECMWVSICCFWQVYPPAFSVGTIVCLFAFVVEKLTNLWVWEGPQSVVILLTCKFELNRMQKKWILKEHLLCIFRSPRTSQNKFVKYQIFPTPINISPAVSQSPRETGTPSQTIGAE